MKSVGKSDDCVTRGSNDVNAQSSNTTRVDQEEEDINSILKNFNAKISNMEGVGD